MTGTRRVRLDASAWALLCSAVPDRHLAADLAPWVGPRPDARRSLLAAQALGSEDVGGELVGGERLTGPTVRQVFDVLAAPEVWLRLVARTTSARGHHTTAHLGICGGRGASAARTGEEMELATFPAARSLTEVVRWMPPVTEPPAQARAVVTVGAELAVATVAAIRSGRDDLAHLLDVPEPVPGLSAPLASLHVTVGGRDDVVPHQHDTWLADRTGWWRVGLTGDEQNGRQVVLTPVDAHRVRLSLRMALVEQLAVINQESTSDG